MKVIISTRAVYPFHGYGGMETYAYFLSKYLAEEDIDVEIITSLSEKEGNISKNPNYTFLPPFVNRKHTKPIRYRLFVRNCVKYLKKSDFAILHAFGVTAYDYLSVRNRKPVIAQPFGSEEFKTNENLIKKIYSDFFIRKPKIYCMQHVDAIASLGEANTQDIINLFKVPKENIFTLPSGIDLNLVAGWLADVKIARKDFGLEDSDLVLMNVNRLAPNKGVPYLIDALKILNNKLDVKLILVGTGSEEQRIKEQIIKLGLEDRIIHFKNIPNEKMFQLYTLADISVTPTLYEGGCPPFVILEAMSAGKPIVATNIPQISESIQNGGNGFLVPPRNPEAIADTVFKIYDKDLIEKMGRKSREIVKNYDWSIIAKKAISKYEELIER